MFMRMIYDETLAQAAYLIGCQRSGEAIVIDPERDVDRYLDLAKANKLKITAVAETHIHADFLSGARELAERVGAMVYVSDEGDVDWKYQWLDSKLAGGSYDHVLLKHGDRFTIGNIEFATIHTPGHTPEHIVFLVTDHGSGADEPMGLLAGDFVFVGDLGRPDLLETAAGEAGQMEPSARRLFHTLSTLDDLPDFVQVWPAHGAGSACGKALGAVPTSTIGYERRFNPAIKAADTEDGFVSFILSGQPEPPIYFAAMKRANKLGPPVLGNLPTPRPLTIDDLASLDTQAVALVDTRSWNEFSSGHVPGSLRAPLTGSFCTDIGSMVTAEDDIYLVVDPAEVERAVRLLVRIGLDRVVGFIPPEAVTEYAESGHSLATIRDMEIDKAAEAIAAGTMAVLDVRRATEHAEGHIDGATNIAHTRLAARLDEVPDGPLIVHCRSGGRSSRAASYLARLGRDVVNLKGGMLAWEASGKPVKRDPAHPHS